MCIATPVKLKKIKGTSGFVENNGNEIKISLSLIKCPKVGDWLLTHGGLAINKLDDKQAKEILQLIK